MKLALLGLLFSNGVHCFAASNTPVATEANRKSYTQEKQLKGVVVLSVNWGRKWGCGEFENAELREIAFDHLGSIKTKPDVSGDLVLKGPLRIRSKQSFNNYVFLVEPGEYALSGYSIKVAQSVSKISFINSNRSELIVEGKARGGSFRVGADEVIYIGHFYLDCAGKHPILWRYYADDWASFRNNMIEVKKEYPFIETENIQYRLFQTEIFGRPHDLPAK